jgi:hypothetical protein
MDITLRRQIQMVPAYSAQSNLRYAIQDYQQKILSI